MQATTRVTSRQVRIASGIITAIGAFYTWQALKLPAGDPLGSGEGGVPIIVGILWVIFGALVTVRTPKMSVYDEEVGTWPDAEGKKRLVLTLALCVGFVALMNTLGMTLTSFIFMIFMARICEASWKKAIIASLITSICVWLLFVHFLQLSLPAGIISSMLPWV